MKMEKSMVTSTKEFVEKMENHIMKIEFEKLDGAIRQMIATRCHDVIPEEHHPKSGFNPVDEEATSVAVFDMQVCGWRSVRPASVKSMSVFTEGV